MKPPRMGRAFCLVVCCLLTGCATPAAPGISGHWTPVNRFDSVPEEIPLSPAYAFYAAPTDRTLKTMLTRWALDSKMTLVYQHPSDFTLYGPLSQVRTGDLHEAVAELNTLYSAQRVLVSIDADTIVVQRSESNAAAKSLSPVAAPASVPVPPTVVMQALPARGRP